MEINIMAYGAAYGSLTKIIRKYFDGRCESIFHLDQMIEEFRSALRSFQDMEGFPAEFYKRMATIIVHWYWDEFRGLRSSEIIQEFQKIWQLHKKYITAEKFTDKELKEATDTVTASLDSITTPPEHRKLYTAVFEDIDRVHKAKEAARQESEAETNTEN